MTGRVAYLVDRYPQRSQTFVRLEVEELRRRGVDVDVVALRPGDVPAPPGDPTLLVRGRLPAGKLAHLRAHARLATRHPLRYLRGVRMSLALRSERRELTWRRLPWVAEHLRRSGTQHVHAHFAWSAAAVAAVVARLAGLPWSVTVHARDLFSDRRNLDVKVRSADLVVTVCEYNRPFLAVLGPLRPVEVVPCGVRVPDAPERRAGPDVVAVGRLVEKKGFDVLVEAVARLCRDGARLDVVIAGDGPLRCALEQQVRTRGLEGVVRLAGGVDHAEALELIALARVLCLPARVAADGDRDSMPVVLKEAMARAVPVVSTPVAAIPELVDDECGWLVAPDDPAALARALAEALGDPGRAEERGRNGRDRVAARFSIEAGVARLHAAFPGAVDEERGRRG